MKSKLKQLFRLRPPTFWSITIAYLTLLIAGGIMAQLTVSPPERLANQGGVWIVQPGNTPNKVPWRVDGSAGLFPIIGSITAILNPLPAGANVLGRVIVDNPTTHVIIDNPPSSHVIVDNPVIPPTVSHVIVDNPTSHVIVDNPTAAPPTVSHVIVDNPVSHVIVDNPSSLPTPSVATKAVSILSSANTPVTATLPAVAGQFHYITAIQIVRICPSSISGTSTLTVTSTNLPGALTWTSSNACVAGLTNTDMQLSLASPLKSVTAGTNTTIVAPAAGFGGLYHLVIMYFTAP